MLRMDIWVKMLRLRFATLSMTRGSSKLALVMLSVAKHPIPRGLCVTSITNFPRPSLV